MSSVYYQRVKLDVGGDGLSVPVVDALPVTAATLPLPTGAATAAKQAALGTAGTPSADVLSVQGVGSGTPVPVSGTVAVSNLPATQPVSGTVAVTGTFWQATQPVSVAATVTVAQADGVYTTPTHTTAGATTASGAALASNASRKYALIINDSDTVVYLKLGATAVANQGIRLNASGGAYEMSKMLGNLTTGAVNCIHGGTGTKTLLVLEGV